MDLNLKGRTALVFGSSSGIGRSIAASLVQEGVKVCLASRDRERLLEAQSHTGADDYVVCDLSLPGSGKLAAEEVLKKFGSLDILVTNTGGPAKGYFLEVDERQWLNDFQSLWMGVVEPLHAVLPKMKERNWGRVLMITSIAAKEPLPGLTTSNGLRAGLAGLARSLATEVAPFGITLNLILPGYTNTERLQALNLTSDRVKQLVPAGRLGAPEEIGDLAAFLASERAGYITGQSFAVDGGVLRSH